MTGVAGRRALVTGAARGLGKQIATDLSKAGCRVVCADINRSDGERTAAGLGAAFAEVDVGDPGAVTRMAEEVRSEQGHVDILVNNAGVVSSTPFLDLSVEEWEDIIRLDLSSAFYLSRAFVPKMCERGYGRVVNVTSLTALTGGAWVGKFAYATAKTGLAGLTRALAREVADYGVTANSVAPGVMDTDMTAGVLGDPNTRKSVESTIPVGYVGDTADVSAVIVFLASEEARYITGQSVNVNGGLRMD
jgi:NAD(P)-dependent dehydrogenase (short-subunit alcohol dehydrogenase family)